MPTFLHWSNSDKAAGKREIGQVAVFRRCGIRRIGYGKVNAVISIDLSGLHGQSRLVAEPLPRFDFAIAGHPNLLLHR